MQQNRTSRNGIETRHQSHCRTRSGGTRCNCQPSYRAVVYDARSRDKAQRTFRSHAEAKAWRAEATRAIREGRLRASNAQTVRDAAELFIEGIEAGTITNRQGTPYKPSTARSYTEAIRLRLLPAFGAHRLADLSRRDLQLYVERLHREGVSASRIHNTINPLRAVYRRALDLGDVAISPCDGLRLPAEQGKRERVAEPDEAARLIAALPERQRALWATAFYTGLRIGELQALAWTHVDLDRNVIRVERSWDRKAGFIAVKSGAGRRTVPVPRILRPYLAARKLETGGRGLVFRSPHGNPFEPSNIRRCARRWWSKAGLAWITPHECRHTYASLMIAAGVNAKALSRPTWGTRASR
jgi:integrase